MTQQPRTAGEPRTKAGQQMEAWLREPEDYEWGRKVTDTILAIEDEAAATERRLTVERIEALIPSEKNEVWWAADNGPRIRLIAGILRQAAAAALATADVDEEATTGMTRLVHNHGTEEGPGLSCPEFIVDNGLVGACLLPSMDTAPGKPTPPASGALREAVETALRSHEGYGHQEDGCEGRVVIDDVRDALATPPPPTMDEVFRSLQEESDIADLPPPAAPSGLLNEEAKDALAHAMADVGYADPHPTEQWQLPDAEAVLDSLAGRGFMVVPAAPPLDVSALRQAAYDALDANPDDDDYALCDRIVDGILARLSPDQKGDTRGR